MPHHCVAEKRPGHHRACCSVVLVVRRVTLRLVNQKPAAAPSTHSLPFVSHHSKTSEMEGVAERSPDGNVGPRQKPKREKKSSIGESYPGMGQTSFLLGPALRLRLVPCVGTCISCSREVDVGFRLPESASQQPKTPRMPVQLLEEVGRGRRPARWSITNAASVPQLRCFEIPQTWTEIRKANQPDTNLAAFCLLETCAIDVDPDATAVSLLALTPTAQASEKGKNGKKRIVNVVGGAARVRSFRFVS